MLIPQSPDPLLCFHSDHFLQSLPFSIFFILLTDYVRIRRECNVITVGITFRLPVILDPFINFRRYPVIREY